MNPQQLTKNVRAIHHPKALFLMLTGMWIGLMQCTLAAETDNAAWPPPVPAADVDKIFAAIPSKAEVATPKQPRKLLVFYRAEAARDHPIGYCNKMLELLAEKTGAFTATFSQDYADLSADRLNQYDAIYLNNTAALKFKGFPERQAMLEFVRSGKGLAGNHAATDNFRDWPEGAEMIGGIFNGHPFGVVHVRNEMKTSPLSSMFPREGFPFDGEIYIFSNKDHRAEPDFHQTYDRSRLQVLLSIDMGKSPDVHKQIAAINNDPKNMYHGKLREDEDYALSWIAQQGKGRVFYTALGHESSFYWNAAMVRHVMAGVQYALGDFLIDDKK